MKNTKLITVAIIVATLLTTSCTKEYTSIEGFGTITTKTLQVDEFTGIRMEGVDNVFITYGAEQKVTVTGHPNIISRIKTDVSNNTWNIELERGTYGHYELTYYLTLPRIERIYNCGTGDVVINDFISQDELAVKIVGTGNFLGFPLAAKNCSIDISGTGDCEVTVEDRLDVNIDGSGHVYYNGNPIIHENISGSGTVSCVNN
jgi:hypothetical protein